MCQPPIPGTRSSQSYEEATSIDVRQLARLSRESTYTLTDRWLINLNGSDTSSLKINDFITK